VALQIEVVGLAPEVGILRIYCIDEFHSRWHSEWLSGPTKRNRTKWQKNEKKKELAPNFVRQLIQIDRIDQTFVDLSFRIVPNRNFQRFFWPQQIFRAHFRICKILGAFIKKWPILYYYKYYIWAQLQF
jgi:hypothetical protein